MSRNKTRCSTTPKSLLLRYTIQQTLSKLHHARGPAVTPLSIASRSPNYAQNPLSGVDKVQIDVL